MNLTEQLQRTAAVVRNIQHCDFEVALFLLDYEVDVVIAKQTNN